MVFVKGGKFNFGNNNGLEREKPEREVTIQSFLIDKNLVTVKDFRQFVNETNYTTEAEVFGNGIVYNDSINIWQLVDGANWQFPLGNFKTIAIDDHPVTQVAGMMHVHIVNFMVKLFQLRFNGNMLQVKEVKRKINYIIGVIIF